MMTPVAREHTTRTLGAPPDWDEAIDGPCKTLPVTDCVGVMYSYWKPSPKERLRIFRGGLVRLGVAGRVHPPVSIDTEE